MTARTHHSRTPKGLLVAAAICAAALPIGAANAADVSLPQTVSFTTTDGTNVDWEDIGASGTSGAFTISDATVWTTGDTFGLDGGSFFVGYSTDSTLTAVTATTLDKTVDSTGDVILDTNDTAIGADGVTASVEHRYFKPASSDPRFIVRQLLTVQNGSATSRDLRIRWKTQFSSGSYTNVITSSTQDDPIATVDADRWAVSSGTAGGINPIITSVWGGIGATPATISLETQDDDFFLGELRDGGGALSNGPHNVRFDVSIGAGETRHFLAFFELTNYETTLAGFDAAKADAIAGTESFNGKPAPRLLAGIALSELPNVANWILLTAPDSPTISSVTRGDERATVVIADPSDNGGAAISQYQARCQRGATVKTSIITSSRTHTVTGLTNGDPWSCSARVNNSVDWSDWSAASSVTPASKPSAPTVASVTAGDNKATVKLAVPSDDGGAAITQYQARCKRGTTVRSSTAATSKTHVVSGLRQGVRWNCSGRAKNSIGWSTWSDTKAVTPR